ncbi:MAG: hypothetical protein Q4F53_07895 [Nesterenkonia sp.]|uniref:hypothetical protein n=1 Tax=Nesterenkonia marinintestina TaxID=2979865 RepID=UPI0021C16F87|nr:hypothetical protein [Nesterenkonia sp. GX14115]MDO5493515.1 hypothetical protein [Nesterenkonia sp.]
MIGRLFRSRTRRLDKELGQGLWRRAHDRYVRGLDRYHQVLEGIADDAVHNDLVLLGDRLAEQLETVRELCGEAHRAHPGEGMLIPGDAADLHAGLSQAANHLATTAEAVAMVRLGAAERTAVHRRSERVFETLASAEAARVGR